MRYVLATHEPSRRLSPLSELLLACRKPWKLPITASTISLPELSVNTANLTTIPFNLHPHTTPQHSSSKPPRYYIHIERLQSGTQSIMSDEDQKLMEQISLLAGKSLPTEAMRCDAMRCDAMGSWATTLLTSKIGVFLTSIHRPNQPRKESTGRPRSSNTCHPRSFPMYVAPAHNTRLMDDFLTSRGDFQPLVVVATNGAITPIARPGVQVIALQSPSIDTDPSSSTTPMPQTPTMPPALHPTTRPLPLHGSQETTATFS